MLNMDYSKPKVFISYSWTSDEYRHYVVELVNALIKNGVDTVIDASDLHPGEDKYVFMERIVNDETINKVLILCDEGYKEKADKRKGGVGDETMIITPEMYGGYNQKKFIPVVMVKDNNGKPYLPTYLKSRLYVDMTTTSGLTDLLRAIYGVPEYVKPPLGKPPAFVRYPKRETLLKCEICGKTIGNDGLLVKLQKPFGKMLRIVPVHKGECDEKLQRFGKQKEINTNSCIEVSSFDTHEDIEAYMNDDYYIGDSEFYIKYYNANGTLKC